MATRTKLSDMKTSKLLLTGEVFFPDSPSLSDILIAGSVCREADRCDADHNSTLIMHHRQAERQGKNSGVMVVRLGYIASQPRFYTC